MEQVSQTNSILVLVLVPRGRPEVAGVSRRRFTSGLCSGSCLSLTYFLPGWRTCERVLFAIDVTDAGAFKQYEKVTEADLEPCSGKTLGNRRETRN